MKADIREVKYIYMLSLYDFITSSIMALNDLKHFTNSK
jgi:hypothetical protein